MDPDMTRRIIRVEQALRERGARVTERVIHSRGVRINSVRNGRPKTRRINKPKPAAKPEA